MLKNHFMIFGIPRRGLQKAEIPLLMQQLSRLRSSRLPCQLRSAAARGIFTFNDAIIMRTDGKNRAEGEIQGRALFSIRFLNPAKNLFHMKTRKILKYSLCLSLYLFILAFIALSAVKISSAGMSFSYHCYDENCKEGTLIDYQVYLTNTANITLTFDNLVLNNYNFNVTYDYDVSSAVTLNPGESHVYNFTREVKALPDNSYAVNIKPCFEVKYKVNENISALYSFCDQGSYNIPILPLANINCNSSDQCASDQTCFYYQCKTPYCKPNEIAQNHVCAPANCGYFQKNVNSHCVSDNSKLAMVLFVIVVVIGGGYFFYKQSKNMKKPSGKKKK